MYTVCPTFGKKITSILANKFLYYQKIGMHFSGYCGIIGKKEVARMYQPLADLLRPQTLDEVYGQEHILGEGAVLRRLI